eukprot:TRINITY_DN15245_c1_g1_i1.p1 TRINITY_DN15245_c1_g1~~TRINITY_DN15245_c1_g1_i1.p1  ORF type:complete len:688 (-),score=162.06 TRINITY_DN15245_c1_g1_i1:1097-3139(-)
MDPVTSSKAQLAILEHLFVQNIVSLKSLIKFDPESFFNVLSVAFDDFHNIMRRSKMLESKEDNATEEDEKGAEDIILETVHHVKAQVSTAVSSVVEQLEKFGPSPLPRSHNGTPRTSVSQTDIKSDPEPSINVQMMVDGLVSLSRSPDSQIEEKSCIFEFLSKYVSLGKVVVDPVCVDEIFQQLLIGSTETSLKGGKGLAKSEREKRLLKLLEIFPSRENRDDVVSKALSSKLFRVCDYIYGLDGDVLNQLRVTILDPSLRDIFEFVGQILQEDAHSRGIKSECRREFLSNFKFFVDLDLQASARMVSRYFPADAETLVSKLDSFPESQFMFLRSLLVLSTAGESELSFTSEKNRKLHEKYISMLCKFAPQEVYSHLVENENYELTTVMQLCKVLNIRDAFAFLLERTGDLAGALDVNLDNLCSHLEKCESMEIENGEEEKEALRLLKVASDLCQRASRRKEESAPLLWNQVLVTLVKLQLRHQKTPSNSLFYNLLVRSVREFVESMSGFIPIEKILKSIFDSGSGLQYRQYKDVIDQILFSFSCDVAILTQAKKCVVSDLYESTFKKVSLQSSAVSVGNLTCRVCQRPIDLSEAVDPKSVISIFRCNHVFHGRCLVRNKCPICSRKVMGSFGSDEEIIESKNADSRSSTEGQESKEKSSTSDQPSLYERFSSLFQPNTS